MPSRALKTRRFTLQPNFGLHLFLSFSFFLGSRASRASPSLEDRFVEGAVPRASEPWRVQPSPRRVQPSPRQRKRLSARERKIWQISRSILLGVFFASPPNLFLFFSFFSFFFGALRAPRLERLGRAPEPEPDPSPSRTRPDRARPERRRARPAAEPDPTRPPPSPTRRRARPPPSPTRPDRRRARPGAKARVR